MKKTERASVMRSSSCAVIGKTFKRGRASINTVRTFDFGHSYDSFVGTLQKEQGEEGREMPGTSTRIVFGSSTCRWVFG